MTDNRKITGDQYPGVTHPSVKGKHSVQCPTCGAKRGQPCTVMFFRRDGFTTNYHYGEHTRTHRTRLNVYRVAQQKRAKR